MREPDKAHQESHPFRLIHSSKSHISLWSTVGDVIRRFDHEPEDFTEYKSMPVLMLPLIAMAAVIVADIQAVYALNQIMTFSVRFALAQHVAVCIIVISRRQLRGELGLSPCWSRERVPALLSS